MKALWNSSYLINAIIIVNSLIYCILKKLIIFQKNLIFFLIILMNLMNQMKKYKLFAIYVESHLKQRLDFYIRKQLSHKRNTALNVILREEIAWKREIVAIVVLLSQVQLTGFWWKEQIFQFVVDLAERPEEIEWEQKLKNEFEKWN